MPLDAPNLDDRTYTDLVREAQLRIPRYCPEWTDFNPADPGTALVELFAWFTELMLYKINQVPERNYVKFLELLNLQPRTARPAKAHVVLTPTPGGKAEPVRARSRFEVPAGGTTLDFETTAAIDLVSYPLDAVQVRDGGEFFDYAASNELAAASFRPFGWTPQAGNALYLGFQPDGPTARAEFPQRLTLRFFVPPPADAAVRLVSNEARQNAPDQTIVWEYRSKNDLARGQDPDDLDRWRPLGVVADETLALTREGTVELRGPGPDILQSKVGRPTADDGPRYWLRCRFAEGRPFPADRVPEVAFVRANVVEVENLATVRDEPLGEADGDRREFRLRKFPVDPPSLVVVVQGVGDDEPWKLVEDFLGSGRDDKHFTLTRSTGQVQFGKGDRGRVPPPGGLVIATTYRSGGGAAGNVPADSITAPPNGVSGLDRVSNPRPATGGKDEETLEALKDRAPQALRGDGRAVTADDYRRLAELVPGVAKATALERRHPDYPGLDVPGTVTVVVVPDAVAPAEDGAPQVARTPMPTQELLDRVARTLGRLRTVGCELFVTGPRYRTIEVRARVVAADGVSDGAARDGVRKAVEDFLAPVPRPVPKAPTAVPAPADAARPVKKPARRYPFGWPFREPFYPSQLYGVVLDAADDAGARFVRNVLGITVAVDGVRCDIGTPVRFDHDDWADALPACVAVVEAEPDTGEGAR